MKQFASLGMAEDKELRWNVYIYTWSQYEIFL